MAEKHDELVFEVTQELDGGFVGECSREVISPAQNRFDAKVTASPAVVGNALILRSHTPLLRLLGQVMQLRGNMCNGSAAGNKPISKKSDIDVAIFAEVLQSDYDLQDIIALNLERAVQLRTNLPAFSKSSLDRVKVLI